METNMDIERQRPSILVRSSSAGLSRRSSGFKRASKSSAIGIQADVEDSGPDESKPVRLVNIIFLPFMGWWQLLILLTVIVRCFFGPMQAVFPFLECPSSVQPESYVVRYFREDHHNLYLVVEFFYAYICEILYIMDTFLYIVHRQVTDEALKREHIAKPAIYLFLDILSLIPLYSLFGGTECNTAKQIWPNILKFNEMLVIYRIGHYFSLNVTHSRGKLITGYIISFLLVINALTSFFLLFTYTGFCDDCTKLIYDWRKYSFLELSNEKKGNEYTYFFAVQYLIGLIKLNLKDDTRPTLFAEFWLTLFLIETAYIFKLYVLSPKLFSEELLRFRSVYTFQGRVFRVLHDTIRRNEASKQAYETVETFYAHMWVKQNGITRMPSVINELPMFLQLEINLDLTWPVFHHSPILRYTSMAYKRWLAQRIEINHKLPGERFFFGPHCYSNMYYIRSGVVQFVSVDDSTMPLISVSGGTVFGDISFLVPPLKRKVVVHCFTNCEIFSITRSDILHSFHNFPEDRQNIMKLAKDRLEHAKQLIVHKNKIRGLDRCVDEGINWLKHRWVAITESVSHWKTSADQIKGLTIMPEEEDYHCSKYIGQLVLCKKFQLHTKTMFNKVTFPWILESDSTFIHLWNKVVKTTVYSTLLLLPSNLVKYQHSEPLGFMAFRFIVDLVFSADVFITILTSRLGKEYTDPPMMTKIVNLMTNRSFLLDLMATPFFGFLLQAIVGSEYWTLINFNDLLKTHVLFPKTNEQAWNLNILFTVYYNAILAYFCFMYVPSYFFYLAFQYLDSISMKFFFGSMCVQETNSTFTICPESRTGDYGILTVALGWLTSLYIPEKASTRNISLINLQLECILDLFYFVMASYFQMKLISSLYSKYRYSSSYQYFVTQILRHYKSLKVHPELMKRLNMYLNFHWKHFNGMDIVYPNVMANEPYDIYSKLHGEAAEAVLQKSKAFEGAHANLIKDLAKNAKFLIIPKGAILNAYGSQTDTITWTVHGAIKCECLDAKGQSSMEIMSVGKLLNISSVFFGLMSMKTYSAASDCEILYMPRRQFVTIIKNYPDEWYNFQTCIEELKDEFETVHLEYRKLHKRFNTNMATRIFEDPKSMLCMKTKSEIVLEEGKKLTHTLIDFFKEYRSNPESRFIRCWMIFRSINVVLALLTSTFEGGSGAVYIKPYRYLNKFCNIMIAIDIMVKFFLPFYDHRGIVISSKKKCALHYLTHTIYVDILGAIGSIPGLVIMVVGSEARKTERCLMICFQLSHLYIVRGCFRYYGDKPSSHTVILEFLYWQLLLLICVIVLSYFYVWDCIWVDWDANYYLNETRRFNESCWLPAHFNLDVHPTVQQLHLTFAQSVSLVQNSFMGVFMGQMHYEQNRILQCIIYIAARAFCWYQTCNILAKQILLYRGDELVHSEINSLKTFLEEERIEKSVINEAIDFFIYKTKRSPPIDIKLIMQDNFSIIFRQDLYYYFYKKTLLVLDNVLRAGVPFCRQLAGSCRIVYFTSNAEVLRENQLSQNLHIVHRGRVDVYKEDKKICTLMKGSIFGQLKGKQDRPSRISVRTTEHADILKISRARFREIMNEQVLHSINKHPTARSDYIKSSVEQENATSSVQYLLRGKKTIKLPTMTAPVSVDENRWYARWLLLSWAILPVIAVTLDAIEVYLPPGPQEKIAYMFYVLDFLYVVYLVTEMFTMELKVENSVCVYKFVGAMIFIKDKLMILCLLSLVLPYTTSIFMDESEYEMFRLLRLYNVYLYLHHFNGIRVNKERLFVKIMLVLLLIHALTCGWLFVACNSNTISDTAEVKIPESRLKFLYHKEWSLPESRSRGCLRTTGNFKMPNMRHNQSIKALVVPNTWKGDYVIAFTFIIILQTNINIDAVMPLTIPQTYYKVFARYVLYLLELWLSSVAISSLYTKFRLLNHYDYNVAGLIFYLKKNGVCKFLRLSVKDYTRLLWRKYKGIQLPEITYRAPLCLQENIFCALYMHHLQTPNIFRNLPMYFLRQVAVRLKRTIIFPGKTIVKEGDIHPTIYFIHEGEVEKLYTDHNGEQRVATVLAINGYFGLLPGLFPNIPYFNTYSSRTIADLIYLSYDSWQDLLNGYPELKAKMRHAAKKLRKEKFADKLIQHSATTLN